jgi:hypothetical protein
VGHGARLGAQRMRVMRSWRSMACVPRGQLVSQYRVRAFIIPAVTGLLTLPVVLVAILLAETRGLIFRSWNSAKNLYEISSSWALF